MGRNDIAEAIKNLTLEQKFAKVLVNLRTLRPFYSAVYEVMEKAETKSIDTCGVTSNKMFYNSEFLESITYPEMVFIILHEVGHISLGHPVRRENRQPDLFNIACDLYVNAALGEEFGLTPGNTVIVNNVSITMPTSALFCSSIDLDKECVEDIYDVLEAQAKKNGFMKSPVIGKSNRNPLRGQQDSSTDGIGSGNDNNGSGQSEQSGQRHVGGGYMFEYHGKKGGDTWGRQGQYDYFKSYLQPNQCCDILIDGEDPSIQKQKSEKIIADAIVRVDMSSTNQGDDGGKLMSIIRKMLKSELDWRKLLRRYLIAAVATDSSFSRPDKRMYYQKSIYPGQVAEESNSIRGVKVCIDTSGSVSDTDLEYFFGQVYDLVSKYHIEAELIYWDAEVQTTGEFKDFSQFKRVDVVGRGGTDPSCVFKYFDSKKCKVKPIVTLMLTDGYFSFNGITAKQRKKYKDTIWIMTRDGDPDFKPPFGKTARAKFKPATDEYKV